MPSVQKLARVLPLALVPLYACTDQSPTAAIAPERASGYTAPAEPVDGEFIRQTNDLTVYISYGRVLYGIPDMQTLRACTGGREKVVREVGALPAWSRRTLPSAGNPQTRSHTNIWMFGDQPIRSDNTADGTWYIVVGCVRSGIPNPATLNALFPGGYTLRTASDAALKALPGGPVASPIPLRRAGSLMESGGTVTWVTSHGASLGIESSQIMDSYCRAWSEMVSNATEYNVYGIKGLRQPGPGPGAGCLRGSDYPWNGQSGSAPYAYPYGQCTSFAAWRLNQDGIDFHNQYLGKHFSDAHTWDDKAIEANIPVDGSPRQGDIAVWNPNVNGAAAAGHVAYVAAVNNNGTVTVEEYNWPTGAGYRTRTVSTSGLKFIHFHR